MAWCAIRNRVGDAMAFCQVELLVDALYDVDKKVQQGAMQSYLHWLAAPSRLSDVIIQDWEADDCKMALQFKYSITHYIYTGWNMMKPFSGTC